MARSGLKMSGKELAEAVGVGLSTIRKVEATDGLPSVHTTNLQQITSYLLSTGRVRFEGESGVFVDPKD
ncbi:hypothetical protein MAH4_25180 [Sessilibacter sp. MAH4]